MWESAEKFLEQLGINDYDELTGDEKKTYHEILNVEAGLSLSIEDFKRHIKTMRQAVEFALASEKLTRNEDLFMKARLKNYILFESFFDRPERAHEMLSKYKQKIK